MLAHLSVVFWGLMAVNSFGDAMQPPYVVWTMDNRSRMHLYPEIKDDRRWIGDLTGLFKSSTQDMFEKGISGDAICVYSSAFTLVRNLTESDCVVNADACSEGISITFWIKLQSLGNITVKEYPIIRTTGGCENGLYIGISNSYLILHLGKDGMSVNVSLIDYGWTNIGATWNSTTQNLALYFNGSKVKGVLTSAKNTCISHDENIMIGNPCGAIFCLDEFKIYYSTLSSHNIGVLSHMQLRKTNNSTSTRSSPSGSNYTLVIVMATVIPATTVIVCVFVTYCVIRRRRTQMTFRLYDRQCSRDPYIENNPAVHSDTEDDGIDLDSEGELAKLHRWFRRDQL